MGFKLAGVTESYTVESGADAEQALKALLQRDDIGLIVIASNLARGIRDRKIANAIDSSLLPMFIVVPNYNEKSQPDTLRRLIIRAIGIDISKTVGG